MVKDYLSDKSKNILATEVLLVLAHSFYAAQDPKRGFECCEKALELVEMIDYSNEEEMLELRLKCQTQCIDLMKFSEDESTMVRLYGDLYKTLTQNLWPKLSTKNHSKFFDLVSKRCSYLMSINHPFAREAKQQ